MGREFVVRHNDYRLVARRTAAFWTERLSLKEEAGSSTKAIHEKYTLNTMLTLDVLIATHTPEGILRVADMNLPVVEGVRYIVSCGITAMREIPPCARCAQ